MAFRHGNAVPLPLALDAMGGDHAPASVIDGAALSLKRFPAIHFLFVGDEAKIHPLLAQHAGLAKISEILHTTETVASDDQPSVALRKAKRSSMRLAIDAVKEGKASGVVSAGNTGAFMAMAKLVMRTLPGITRPAIIGRFPNPRGDIVMLDLGATVEASAHEMFTFAVMGKAFAKAVLQRENPTIGILNIGSEEMKGHNGLREAAALLRAAPLDLNFIGFVEGNDICNGDADVIVTDGFTGNIALKTAEGTSHFMYMQIKQAFKSSQIAKLGYLFAKPAFNQFKKVLDPRRLNGAMFIGLNGVAVKSHGGADALGFASAINAAYSLVEGRMNEKIIEQLTLAAEKGYEETSPSPSLESLAEPT